MVVQLAVHLNCPQETHSHQTIRCSDPVEEVGSNFQSVAELPGLMPVGLGSGMVGIRCTCLLAELKQGVVAVTGVDVRMHSVMMSQAGG